MNNLHTCTKDKQVLDSFIDSSLISLGLNLFSNGFKYYKKAILIALETPFNQLVLDNIYKKIAKEYNTTPSRVKQNIDTVFHRSDNKLCIKNFKRIFKISFQYSYFTPKNIIILFLRRYTL